MADDAPFSLLDRPWLPVLRASGARDAIRPAEITSRRADDPVTALDWPRPDLRVACTEFLIGLLATACPPADTGAWLDGWTSPPSPERLDEAFAPFADAFVLDGDGDRFCQDHNALPADAATRPIEWMFLDGPGENTFKKNTDIIIKRGGYPVLSRAAAALALYTMQAWASLGGPGYTVGPRGGGPLTTLVVPGPREDGRPRPLWHLLWANVPQGVPPSPADLPLVFPWLAKTRTFKTVGSTALDGRQAHPLQALWGMPRRIRLEIAPAEPGEVCALTGEADPLVVRAYRTCGGGVQYADAAARHPLSPLYRKKETEPWLAVHPQPEGIGWRHWHELAGEPTPTTSPARVVSAFVTGHRALSGRDRAAVRNARVLAAGFDMGQDKARGFVEATMPLFAGDAAAARRAMTRHAAMLAAGATEAARLLRDAVRAALASQAKYSAALFSTVQARFHDALAPAFWREIDAAHDRGEDAEGDAAVRAWLGVLRRHAIAGFDDAAPLDPLSPHATAGRNGEPPPLVVARRNLGMAFAGWGKDGAALFKAVGLTPPEAKKTSKKETAR